MPLTDKERKKHTEWNGKQSKERFSHCREIQSPTKNHGREVLMTPESGLQKPTKSPIITDYTLRISEKLTLPNQCQSKDNVKYK